MTFWVCLGVSLAFMGAYKLCSPRAEWTQLAFLVAAAVFWLAAVASCAVGGGESS